jgi:plasmid stability protein
MAQILIRNIEPELMLALERRAERNNRTLEAEVLEILRVVLDKEDEETAVARHDDGGNRARQC